MFEKKITIPLLSIAQKVLFRIRSEKLMINVVPSIFGVCTRVEQILLFVMGRRGFFLIPLII